MELEKCKEGVKVSLTRRNGEGANAVITGAPQERGKGMWVPIEYVDDKGKKNGKTAWKRASELDKR
jgi:hypothetical protein